MGTFSQNPSEDFRGNIIEFPDNPTEPPKFIPKKLSIWARIKKLFIKKS